MNKQELNEASEMLGKRERLIDILKTLQASCYEGYNFFMVEAGEPIIESYETWDCAGNPDGFLSMANHIDDALKLLDVHDKED